MKYFVMIHHSLTKDSETVSWRAIERYHRQVRGWRDIGYHYGVEKTNDGWIAMVGRPEEDDAAACKEGFMNHMAVHICCVGNYDQIEPPEEMLQVLIGRLVVPLLKRYHLTEKQVLFHREYAPYKSCPGTKWDLEKFREKVKDGLR